MALQRFERDVFGDQQLEPVEQLAGRWLFLQAGQVAHVIKGFHGGRQQFLLQPREVHVDDFLHGLRFGKLDVVEKAAAQKGVGQFFFVVRGDEDQWPVLGFDEFAGFVAVELHAVDLPQQVVRKFNVSLVDFVDQQRHRLVSGEGLPQHAFEDVVVNVLDFFVAQLRVAQARDGVIFVQALLRFGGRLDVPLQQGQFQCLGYFFGQHGFAGAGLAFDQQRFSERGGGVHGQHQVFGGDVVLGTLKFHVAMG